MQMQYNHTSLLLIQIIHNYSKCSLLIYCNWPNGTGNWWHNWIVVLEKWQGFTQRGVFQGKGGTNLIWSPQSGFPSCFSREVWIISESLGSGPHGPTSTSPFKGQVDPFPILAYLVPSGHSNAVVGSFCQW